MNSFNRPTYDDKIDAMRQLERGLAKETTGRWAREYYMQPIEQDKRNTERLETYRLKRGAMDRLLGAAHNALESMGFERA